jgi:lipopolysaccharide export system permease protein
VAINRDFMKDGQHHGEILCTLHAEDLQVDDKAGGTMHHVSITSYRLGKPAMFYYAEEAVWDSAKGRWVSRGKEGFSTTLGEGVLTALFGESDKSELSIASLALIKDSPFDLNTEKKDPAELTAGDMRTVIAHLRTIGDPDRKLGWWRTRLIERYSTPFTCLVFALIGAPLGLRHHRTSSAVGLGISLIVIFIYYFISVYLATFGDSATVSPYVAAWTPNILSAVLGIGLIVKANQ